MNYAKPIKRVGTFAFSMTAFMLSVSAHAFTIDNSNHSTITATKKIPAITTTITPVPSVPAKAIITKPIVAEYSSASVQNIDYHGIDDANLANQYHKPIFDELAVSTNSSAVAVMDLQSGNLIYSKNIDTTRSIASISKVMTAMVIVDAGLDMREMITIIPSDLVGAKQATTKLRTDDRLSRSEFTLMMLMKSENPAAKALARTYPGGYEAFIAAMNAKAASLGMYQTRFSDSSGLDPRNVSSANDLVKMMKAVSSDPRYQLIRTFSTAPNYDFYIANASMGDRTYKANNTSTLVRSGEHPIGVSKTGFIREAGYCVVMETHVNNKPVVIVLLGAGASQTRWNDARNILTELAYRR